METSNREIKHRCYSIEDYESLYTFFKGLPNQELLVNVLAPIYIRNVNRNMKKRFKNKSLFKNRDCYNVLYLASFEDLPTLLGHPNSSVGFLASWRILNNKK